ncbi:MAG: dimethylarginine dimethylaminohydrolase family protein [Rhodobacterales bacterium]|jgi:dimethylargininase
MFSVSSMTASLKKVALLQPNNCLKDADPNEWHYGSTFDPEKVEGIHASFVKLLEAHGIEIYWIEDQNSKIADAVFTYDASLMTKFGAILMSPGKLLRSGEQDLHKIFYNSHDIPIIGSISDLARAEAGDTLWLDETTLVVGRGFRTNQLGVEQIKDILEPRGINVFSYDLPFYTGAAACLHLMSLISLVDTKAALVALPLLPVGFYELLTSKGFQLIEAPMLEFEQSNTLSTNVLAVSPGNCVMLSGLPQTTEKLRKSGIKVQLFDGDALCVGCEGGPTCLTRPLYRV